MGKPWYQSKTILFNLALIAVQTAQQLSGVFQDGRFHSWLLTIAMVGNIVLREVTKDPLQQG